MTTTNKIIDLLISSNIYGVRYRKNFNEKTINKNIDIYYDVNFSIIK